MSLDLTTPVSAGLDAVHTVQDRAGDVLDTARSVDVTKAARATRRRERRLSEAVVPAIGHATRRARRARRRADRMARRAGRHTRATVDRLTPAPHRRRGRKVLVTLVVVGGVGAAVAVLVRRMRDVDATARTTAGTPDPFGAAVAVTEDERADLQRTPTAGHR